MKKGLPPILDKTRRVLILGTMPGERSIALQQYYGNNGNRFWKILFTVFDTEFSAHYQDRLNLLADHKIALWNVLEQCDREGSADHKIRNEKPNDFEWLHDTYLGITHIFFESMSARNYFLKHCVYKPGITYKVLPSTSGLNAGLSYAEKLRQWQEIKIDQ
ncbi:MAG: DNA-deoxyinosine glycosylase [Bacteroidia bacterium]